MIVEPEEAETRLDKLLATRYPDYSRTYFQYLISEGLVLINGERSKKRTLVSAGDEIEIEFALTPEISLEPENIPLDILYEDDHLLAINKPAGMVVHPGTGNWSGTFVNALLFHCKELPHSESLRPGIVHRLDKGTSGLLLAAKTEAAQSRLVDLFAKRQIKKEYIAICIGNPGNRTIEGNIGRHPIRRKEMTLVKTGGKEAITHIKTEEHDAHLSRIRLFPETGRTHQLRVHLKHAGFPILGDPVYGNSTWNTKYTLDHQLLHAQKLIFTHPITEQPLELTAPFPPHELSLYTKFK